MVVIWGQRMYGRVDRFAGSHVATRFFHLYYVPLIPLSSWLVLEEQADGRFLGMQVPLQLKSVLLAWLRIASSIALVVMLGRAWSMPREIEAIREMSPELVSSLGLVSQMVINSLFLVGVAGVCVYSWWKLGRLSRAEQAKRVVYWDFAGKFVDVALLGDGRGSIKHRATEELDRHLIKHATASYREAPQSSWREVATRDDQRDVALLRAALTRCRIEWSEASGSDKSALHRDHEKIFANLAAASPDVLSTDKFDLRG